MGSASFCFIVGNKSRKYLLVIDLVLIREVDQVQKKLNSLRLEPGVLSFSKWSVFKSNALHEIIQYHILRDRQIVISVNKQI